MTDSNNHSDSQSTAPSEPQETCGGRFCPFVAALKCLKKPAVWLPLLLLIAATAVFRFTDIDLMISRPFFVQSEQAGDSQSHWPLKMKQPWKTLYDYGVLPAWILGGGGLTVFLASFAGTKLRPYRDAGLFFALMLALGPGLMVNGILKPCWSRPRPHQTTPFGGGQDFLIVGDIGRQSESFSFPSGHASMGFYLMVPAFVLYRRRPYWAAAFMLLGLSGGTIMGLARIVAGGHFASDVIWAAGVDYFTGLALYALFRWGNKFP